MYRKSFDHIPIPVHFESRYSNELVEQTYPHWILTSEVVSNFQVFRKLTTLFKSLGVKAIFDTSCSRDLTLIESCNEFITRYNQSTDDARRKSLLPMISSACPGICLSL